jgi:hypothetical protein
VTTFGVAVSSHRDQVLRYPRVGSHDTQGGSREYERVLKARQHRQEKYEQFFLLIGRHSAHYFMHQLVTSQELEE